jgi:pimeloyl-ACP methyl ester carboxylesterase
MDEKKSLSTSQGKVNYRVTGLGKVILLVHGFGEEGNVWNGQLPAINDYRVIIPDLPGSGSSDMVEDMSMEGMAEVLKKILDLEMVNSCILIGHSMGGYIAMAFAEKYPGTLEGLGLFHSSALPDTEEKKQSRKKGIEFIKQHGAFEFLKTSVPDLFSPISKDEIPERIDEFIQSLSNFSANALVSYYNAMMQRPDRSSILKTLSFPILFILGKFDVAVPPQDGLKQSHLPNLSYLGMLNKSGHMGMIEETEKANHFLKEYLKLIC